MGETRRRVILSLTSAITLANPKSVFSQPVDVSMSDRGVDFRSHELAGAGLEGTDPALTEERETAAEILIRTGKACKTPLQFFTTFEALSRPDIDGGIRRNKDGELYNEGWRTRWNPVIVKFFQETRTQPSGDETFWCAASLNWCLARSGLRTTRSASSGSFRNADRLIDPTIYRMIGDAMTTTPKPGDVVVFRDADPTRAGFGRGHVALFLEETPNKVHVIGGNQLTTGGHHGFSNAWFPKSGTQLVLDSYRSIDKFAA